MDTILVVMTSLGQVVGSLVAAVTLCWLLWRAFALIHHPELAAGGILILVALSLTDRLPDSQMLDLTLAYAFAAAVPLWLGGTTWRKAHIVKGTDKTRASTAARK